MWIQIVPALRKSSMLWREFTVLSMLKEKGDHPIGNSKAASRRSSSCRKCFLESAATVFMHRPSTIFTRPYMNTWSGSTGSCIIGFHPITKQNKGLKVKRPDIHWRSWMIQDRPGPSRTVHAVKHFYPLSGVKNRSAQKCSEVFNLLYTLTYMDRRGPNHSASKQGQSLHRLSWIARQYALRTGRCWRMPFSSPATVRASALQTKNYLRKQI